MAASIAKGLKRKVNEIARTVQGEQQRLKAERHAIEVDRTRLEEERAAFQAEKEMVAAANGVATSKVKLDVGGTIYHVSRRTLTSMPGSMLEAMFSGRHELKEDEDGRVFIDRDSAVFKLVLEYLRSPASFSLEGLTKREIASCKAEFDYFGLPSPSPVPSPVPLSLRTSSHVQLQNDGDSCTISVDGGSRVAWAVGSEVLADDAVWKAHVKQPSWLVMGVIVNPTPSACAHQDATFAGWDDSPNRFYMHGRNQASPGWPRWKRNDEAIFKLNAAARTLTLHLKQTGQTGQRYIRDLPAGTDGQWRLCTSMFGRGMVVLSRPTDEERALVQ